MVKKRDFTTYVPRLKEGDFDIGGGIFDGEWQIDGIDLSEIVPAEATGVIFAITSWGTNMDFEMRVNETYGIDRVHFATTAGGGYAGNVDGHHILPCEADRKFDYRGINVDGFYLVVLGWFI